MSAIPKRGTAMRTATRVLLGACIAAAGFFATTARPMAADEPTPTFTKEIAPIFYKSCVDCHRPGQIAPMSLLSYDTARPWARAIKDRTAKREMPPWHVDE